jgi:cellulose synthase/poly-beta-1,6-N-acetylglucosamine synthase-like glycosyltransferase
MTWWGALGLALSLYGVVVLLEWVYDYLIRSHRRQAVPVSLVLRLGHQEERVEHVLRTLIRIFSQEPWTAREFEVWVFDASYEDRTQDIVDRLCRNYSYFRMAPSSTREEDLLAQCRFPVVVWLDLSAHAKNRPTLDALSQLLVGLGRA